MSQSLDQINGVRKPPSLVGYICPNIQFKYWMAVVSGLPQELMLTNKHLPRVMKLTCL